MEAILLVGLQGAGKTTFYEERFRNTHVRISLDLLGSRAKELALLNECLSAGRGFVVDNVNARVEERARYIGAALSAGLRITGYFFDVPLRAAIYRNARRTDKRPLPVPAIIATSKRLVKPRPTEGFTELFSVEVEKEKGFIVKPLAPS